MRVSHLLATTVLTCSITAGTAGCSADPPAVAEPAASAAPPVEAPPAETAKPRSKLTETRFGKPIGEGETVSLASIVAEPAKYAGKQVKTEGVVKSVCKAAGCWMEVEEATGRAHVKMAGHSFYVPKNCDGHRAVIQGTVAAGAPEDTCGAKDSCGGEGNGALAKLEIAADGVEFID
jgi:hypothetical protein